jgi:hypothetical protein
MTTHKFLILTLCIIGLTNCKNKALLCYKHKKNISESGNMLIKSYKTLINTKPNQFINPNDTFYSISSTMPADEFGNYGLIAHNVPISFGAVYQNQKLTYIRDIWNWRDSSYTYYGAIPPKPNYFPYPHGKNYEEDSFCIKFIPTDIFQKAGVPPNWLALDALKAINFKDVQKVKCFYMECNEGYLNKHFPDQYKNPYSALGIIVQFKLLNGNIVSCYLVTNDMQPTPLNHVLWKKKVVTD